MRSWMYKRLVDGFLNLDFVAGVETFVSFCQATDEFVRNGHQIRCPCRKCKNKKILPTDTVKKHLYSNGFISDYYRWVYQGETLEVYNATTFSLSTSEEQRRAEASTSRYGMNSYDHTFEPPSMRDMVMDGDRLNTFSREEDEDQEPILLDGEDMNAEAAQMFHLFQSARRPLYDGCSVTQLAAATELLNIKASYHISDAGYNSISQWYHRCSPSNILPTNFYETKKLVGGLGLPVEKIDCCRNGCMIFWGEVDKNLTECRFCCQPRFKQGKHSPIPFKRMFYLPITPRLQRLYASERTASHMRWHREQSREEGVMRHPSDGNAWKHLDQQYPEFAAESRNVRLGLCTDGFNPFGAFGSKYSLWPVILTPYNLPPSMCMKDPVMYLTVIIPGPKNPKQKIDVYMQPLIAELKSLWNDGVLTYDVSRKRNFIMRAAVIWTISDFPAYSMLSGWSTSGKLACPHCMEDTNAFYLPHGRKTCWFDCHRRFLPTDNVFRKNTNDFKNGQSCRREEPPRVYSGSALLGHINYLGLQQITEIGAEANNKHVGRNTGWKKKSIFWELPYWEKLLIRHNLDVMHIEKNVFDNIFNTLLNIAGKTKDNLKARLDIADICRRPELNPVGDGKKFPKAKYTLDNAQKKILFDWMRSIKFPDGYASNLSRCIDSEKLSVFGMKSHDCHVFMQRLLPTAFRPFLENKYWEPLTQLSVFFRELTSADLNTATIELLHKEIPVILCKLERIFPPSFFDSMEHLPIHLPFEALIGGPVQYRWMYPFERYLHRLKLTVKNKARVEGSICNAYLAYEMTTFSSYYFEQHVAEELLRVPRNFLEDLLHEDVDRDDLPIFTHVGQTIGKSARRGLTNTEYHTIQTFVLRNCEEVEPYIELYLNLTVRPSHHGITRREEIYLVDANFRSWFYNYVTSPTAPVSNPHLIALAAGPSRVVRSYTGYITKGFRFQTKAHCQNKRTNSSGIFLEGAVFGDNAVDFYGYIDEIIELEYLGSSRKRIVIFNCTWFETIRRRGVRTQPNLKVLEVNKKKKISTEDRFVFAQQASQIFYLPYPKYGVEFADWLSVCKVKSRNIDESLDENDNNEDAFQDEDTSEVRTINDDVQVYQPLGPLNDENEILSEEDSDKETDCNDEIDCDEEDIESTDSEEELEESD